MTDPITPISNELAFQVGRQKQLLSRDFAAVPVWDVATITHVQSNGDGHPAWALTEKGYRIDLSLGTPMAEQEEWLTRLDGGPVSGRWTAVARLATKGDLLGPLPGRFIPPPVIPTEAFGGWTTAQDGDAQAAAGGVPRSYMVIYPRSVALSAGYDVYSQHYPIIHTRMRVTGTSAWQAMTTDNLHPAAPLYITLAANVTNATTAWSVTVPAAVLPEIDLGQNLFWYCDGECVVGSLSGATLTVSARGVDGTMAAAHLAGASIQLLSAKVPLGNLAVGTTFDVQLSFGGVYAEVGGWSNIVSVTTWQQTAPPAAIDSAHFTVNLDTDAWHLKWDPLPDASVRQYRILRYDVGLPPPGGHVPDYLAGGALDLGLVDATTALIPANGVVTGSGIYFGIAARNSSGLEGVVVWNSNAWIPQSPNPAMVSLTPIPSGILFSVADPAPLVASGFKQYALWRANDTSGTGAVKVDTFAVRATQLSHPVTNFGVLQTYQVTSRNWEDMESSLDNVPAHGYWKYATSFGPSDQIPPNGNFEVPDAQNQYPLYWQHAAWYTLNGVTTGSPAGLSMGYAQTGGMAGSKCWHFHSDGGASIPAGAVITWYIISTILIPYNRLKATWVDFWLKSATVWPPFATVARAALWLYQDPGGTVPGTDRVLYSENYALNVGGEGRSRIPFSFGPYCPIGSLTIQDPARRQEAAYAAIGLEITSTDWNDVLDIYLDDFVAAFDMPNNPGIVVVDTTIKIT